MSVKAARLLYRSQVEDFIDRARSRGEKALKKYQALSKYARKPTRKRLWNSYLHNDMLAEEAVEEVLGRYYLRMRKLDDRLAGK